MVINEKSKSRSRFIDNSRRFSSTLINFEQAQILMIVDESFSSELKILNHKAPISKYEKHNGSVYVLKSKSYFFNGNACVCSQNFAKRDFHASILCMCTLVVFIAIRIERLVSFRLTFSCWQQ